MTIFIIIGAVGLVLLLLSLVLGEVFELADGDISGTSIGAGAVVFGACGAIVTVNRLPMVLAYVAAAVFALLAMVGFQKVVSRLRDTEDGQPRTVTGTSGVVTATIPTAGNGEVSLDDPRELERRLAWADAEIATGTRIVVLEQSGSRVKVAPVTAATPSAPAATDA